LVVDVTGVSPATSPPFAAPNGTVTVTISGVSGTQTITLDSTGHGVLQISSLPSGSHSVTATYNGNTNYKRSNTGGTIGGATTTGLASDGSPSVAYDAVVLTATVTYNPGGLTPSGTVTFVDTSNGNAVLGSKSLDSNGVATLTVSSLSAGSHTIE